MTEVASTAETTQSRYTRCPGCSTVFRVTAAQLALREGQVRCGHCRAVFDANDHFVSLNAGPPPDDFDPSDEMMMSRSAAFEAPPSSTEKAAVEEAPSREAPSGREASVEAAAGEATVASEERAIEEAATAEPAIEEPAVEDTPTGEAAAQEAASEEAASKEAATEQTPTGEAAVDEAAVEDAAAEEEAVAESAVVEHVEGPTLAEQSASGEQVDEPADQSPAPGAGETRAASNETDAGTDDKEAAADAATADGRASLAPVDLGGAERFEWKKRAPADSSRRIYAPLAALLVAGLALQAVVEYRDALAARVPATRPLLESACTLFNCSVEPLRDGAALSIDASDLQADPAHRGLLVLSATVRNRAAHPIAYPYLELTLTDASDRIVARRAFAPSEYAGGTADLHQGIAPNGERLVRMFLDASATQQAGYRLYLFYP